MEAILFYSAIILIPSFLIFLAIKRIRKQFKDVSSFKEETHKDYAKIMEQNEKRMELQNEILKELREIKNKLG
ncbi:hypothetical protein QRD89_16555 [Halobacillus sp. ACCC02827]|uniref:hypothetical protein n=1 Tax=unclassified Halobacillus TaxID=2636472 RepID=UPI0002A4E283|nr:MULTISPECIES: hypothetical protein [unclassified Halobacillus]ELK48758.1 hypothetical protein D479_01717 [Halobacillus sp. BAB-2008]WJE15315.1 hypothetical protein QRD89_16555 [Halobacillus sp. ACCC02827]